MSRGSFRPMQPHAGGKSRGSMPRLSAIGRLIVEHEGHLHSHAVFGDAAVVDACLLLDDVEAGDAAQGSARPLEAVAHGIVEAAARGCRDLANACDAHDVLPQMALPVEIGTPSSQMGRAAPSPQMSS